MIHFNDSDELFLEEGLSSNKQRMYQTPERVLRRLVLQWQVLSLILIALIEFSAQFGPASFEVSGDDPKGTILTHILGLATLIAGNIIFGPLLDLYRWRILNLVCTFLLTACFIILPFAKAGNAVYVWPFVRFFQACLLLSVYKIGAHWFSSQRFPWIAGLIGVSSRVAALICLVSFHQDTVKIACFIGAGLFGLTMVSCLLLLRNPEQIDVPQYMLPYFERELKFSRPIPFDFPLMDVGVSMEEEEPEYHDFVSTQELTDMSFPRPPPSSTAETAASTKSRFSSMPEFWKHALRSPLVLTLLAVITLTIPALESAVFTPYILREKPQQDFVVLVGVLAAIVVTAVLWNSLNTWFKGGLVSALLAISAVGLFFVMAWSKNINAKLAGMSVTGLGGGSVFYVVFPVFVMNYADRKYCSSLLALGNALGYTLSLILTVIWYSTLDSATTTYRFEWYLGLLASMQVLAIVALLAHTVLKRREEKKPLF